jgi:hypothetical protein
LPRWRSRTSTSASARQRGPRTTPCGGPLRACWRLSRRISTTMASA